MKKLFSTFLLLAAASITYAQTNKFIAVGWNTNNAPVGSVPFVRSATSNGWTAGAPGESYFLSASNNTTPYPHFQPIYGSNIVGGVASAGSSNVFLVVSNLTVTNTWVTANITDSNITTVASVTANGNPYDIRWDTHFRIEWDGNIEATVRIATWFTYTDIFGVVTTNMMYDVLPNSQRYESYHIESTYSSGGNARPDVGLNIDYGWTAGSAFFMPKSNTSITISALRVGSTIISTGGATNVANYYFTSIGNGSGSSSSGSSGSASNVFFLDSPSISWSQIGGSNYAQVTTSVTNAWQNYTLAASNSITSVMTNLFNTTSNILWASKVTTNLPLTLLSTNQGSSLSNTVDLIAGDSSVTIVTNANKRSFTITAAGSGTNGGATNVFFLAGQNTSWRTVTGSNVVDVVGTLTNNTTGNATTSTTSTNLIGPWWKTFSALANSTMVSTNGALWMPPATFGGVGNNYGGTIQWGAAGVPSWPYAEGSGTQGKGQIGLYHNWGGGASNSTPVMLFAAPNHRIENGWNTSTRDTSLSLGNEDTSGTININYQNSGLWTASRRLGNSYSLNFQAINLDATWGWSFANPGIMAFAKSGNAYLHPQGGHGFFGELWFYTAGPIPDSNGEVTNGIYAGVPVMIMHTNSLEVLGSIYTTNLVAIGSGATDGIISSGFNFANGFQPSFVVGANNNTMLRTSGTDKVFSMALAPRTSGNPTHTIFTDYNNGDYPTLSIGGGLSSLAPHAEIDFYVKTGPITTTGAGNLQMKIVDGTITQTNTIFTGTITGNGSGLSNAVDLIAGSNITITTNANKRSFTLTSTGGSGIATNGGTGINNRFTNTVFAGTIGFSNDVTIAGNISVAGTFNVNSTTTTNFTIINPWDGRLVTNNLIGVWTFGYQVAQTSAGVAMIPNAYGANFTAAGGATNIGVSLFRVPFNCYLSNLNVGYYNASGSSHVGSNYVVYVSTNSFLDTTSSTLIKNVVNAGMSFATNTGFSTALTKNQHVGFMIINTNAAHSPASQTLIGSIGVYSR